MTHTLTLPALDAATVPPTHPTTREGLKDLLARDIYLAEQRPSQDAPEAIRRRYNGAIASLAHRPMRQFLDTGHKWIEIHQGRMPAKWLGVEGAFHSGKTAMGVALSLSVCRAQWSALGDEIEDAEGTHVVYPVVYVVVGDETSERQFCELIITALDMPEPARRDTDSLSKMLSLISRQMRRSRTLLLVVDDMHQMPAGRGRRVTKFLKQTFSTLPCTLLFIADDLEDTHLLKPSMSDRITQVASQQLSERKIITQIRPISMDATGVEEWTELVRLCLDNLVLRDRDSLTGVDYQWLRDTCKGDRAKLLGTVLLAGRNAVGNSERIDREGLEAAAREQGS